MQHGINPYVIVPDSNGIVPRLRERNIPTLVLNYRDAAYPRRRLLKDYLLFLPKLAGRIIVNHKSAKVLTTWLKENKIDIVHTNSGVIRIGFDAAQKNGIPHVYHIREYADLDFGINYFPNRKAFHSQLKKANSYSICITKDIQRHNRQHDLSTSRVIYDGVFDASESMPQNANRHFFLYMGRIQYAKGLDLLLEAYRHYVETAAAPLPLKVAGSIADSVYYQQQKQAITKYGLDDKVHFLGECDDVVSILKGAKALIIPSRTEGFGFCMPEAMHQGCLCIAHNTGGTKEQLDNAHELTGKEIALRWDTTDELACLLTEAASLPAEKYLSLTELAFRVVNQLYTTGNNVQQIINFYHFILNETHH